MRSGFLGWLSRTRNLIIMFTATILIFAAFHFVLQAIDGPLLDMLWSGDRAIVRLNEMDDYERDAHFWATVTLDVVLPLAYAGALSGLLTRLAWNWRWLLIWIPICTALADYSENLVQALAMSGYAPEILHAKDVVTPLKFGGLGLSVVLCILLGLNALVRKISNKQNTEDA